jgi:hypothetical protein
MAFDGTIVGALIGAAATVAAAVIGGRYALRARETGRQGRLGESPVPRVRVAGRSGEPGGAQTGQSQSPSLRDTPATLVVPPAPTDERYASLKGDELAAAFLADAQLELHAGDNFTFIDTED